MDLLTFVLNNGHSQVLAALVGWVCGTGVGGILALVMK